MAERYRDRDRYDRDRDRGYDRDERGMMERAGDEVRSWFGDDEAQRRRERDERESGGGQYGRGYRPPQGAPYSSSSGGGERGWSGGSERGWSAGTYPDRDRVSDYDADEARPRRDWNMAASRPARLSGSAASSNPYEDSADRGSRRDYFDRDDRSYSSYQRTFGADRDLGRGAFGGQDIDRGSRYGGYQERGSTAGGYAGSYGSLTEGRGQFSGRGPKGYERSDERIREDVCDRLADDPHIDASDIEISVNKGEVTLSGFVRDREDKRHAEDLVERISGVREVHNSLRVNRGGANPGDVIGLSGASGTGNTPPTSGPTIKR